MKIMNVKGTVDSLPSKEIIRRKLSLRKPRFFGAFFMPKIKK